MSKIQTRAERNIAWCEEHLRVPDGQFVGQPLKLAEYMKEDFRAIYDNPHGVLTRRAIISRGRKNAKTTETAMVVLLHLCGPEARPNSQLYSAAQSRDQAAILFSLAAKMARMSPALADVLDIKESAKSIVCDELGAVYKALSADAPTAYGLSPTLIIHDELGQVRGPKFDLYDALESATGAQANPISIVISTQAPNDNDLLSILIDNALNGDPETGIKDPKTVLRFNTAPEHLDPFSIEAIEAANPAFHVFMNKTEVLDMQRKAKEMPTSQADFENLVLNRRVETKSPFISSPVWKRCGFPLDMNETNPIFGGLDLSSVSDLTALVYVQQVKNKSDDDYKWHVEPHFWIPELGVHEKQRIDKVPYLSWKENGFINFAHNSSTIEYEYIAEQIMEEIKQGRPIKKIAFDKYNYRHLKPWLKKVGFKDEDVESGETSLFMEFSQSATFISPALRSLESLILNQKIAHDNNPVLSWNVSNGIAISDTNGNRKLIKNYRKGNVSAKIDGLIGLTMAIGIAETIEIKPKQQPKLIFI